MCGVVRASLHGTNGCYILHGKEHMYAPEEWRAYQCVPQPSKKSL